MDSHLSADGERLYLSHGHHGLVQPKSVELAPLK